MAGGLGQSHVDLHRRPIDGDVVDQSQVNDVELEIGILDAPQRELDLIFGDDASRGGSLSRGRSWCVAHPRNLTLFRALLLARAALFGGGRQALRRGAGCALVACGTVGSATRV